MHDDRTAPTQDENLHSPDPRGGCAPPQVDRSVLSRCDGTVDAACNACRIWQGQSAGREGGGKGLHAYHIYAKLDVKKRTQAVSKARQLGIIL
jgi:hypothetical protein